MAVDENPLAEVLNAITESLVAAKDAFPEDAQSINPPQDGISLLDVKNELLLSYLHHLVFLILLRLHNRANPSPENLGVGKTVISKLIELRAYLDRGVRPLEGRLRYQIDKVLRAAEDSDRTAAQKGKVTKDSRKERKQKSKGNGGRESDVSPSGSELENSDDGSEEDNMSDEETAAAPGAAALAARARESTAVNSPNNRDSRGREGVYKPPRLNPVTMPETSSRAREDMEDTRIARRRKNALLEEYINEEHSNTPTAQPSIGSNNTILDRGRQHTSLHTRDRDRERERTNYEERNFIRLPAASKAEKKKDRSRQQKDARDMFGGEDWTGLGGLGDRIGKSFEGRGGKASLLDRREKRKYETTDMPRNDGVGIGETFEKKRKVLEARTQRKKGRR